MSNWHWSTYLDEFPIVDKPESQSTHGIVFKRPQSSSASRQFRRTIARTPPPAFLFPIQQCQRPNRLPPAPPTNPSAARSGVSSRHPRECQSAFFDFLRQPRSGLPPVGGRNSEIPLIDQGNSPRNGRLGPKTISRFCAKECAAGAVAEGNTPQDGRFPARPDARSRLPPDHAPVLLLGETRVRGNAHGAGRRRRSSW